MTQSEIACKFVEWIINNSIMQTTEPNGDRYWNYNENTLYTEELFAVFKKQLQSVSNTI